MFTVYGVTYDHTNNYGTCFQAYALQTAIEKCKLGESGEECVYHLIPVKLLKEYPKVSGHSIKILAAGLLRKLHRRQFNPFERKHMKFVPITSFSQLDSLNDEADAFVCGSDVIWSPDFSKNLGVYYLDFAHKYKFSYAASFGNAEIDKGLYEEIGRRLSSFDAISVREPSGAEIVRQCQDKPVRVVADPVLLLGRSEWEPIAVRQEKSSPYIFVYMTHTNAEIESFIDRLRQETGLRVVRVVWENAKALGWQGIQQVQSPELWLAQLRDAEYIVTNSFHATVFCTIFHKKFFTVVHGEKDGGVNIRMYDYLNKLCLQDRMFSSVPEVFDLSEIDFSGSDEIIAEMREEGMHYLQENLEAAYAQKQQEGKA